MQNDWGVDKAKQMQVLAEANDQKGFYDLLRSPSPTGNPPKGLSPVKAQDGCIASRQR